MTCRYSRPLHPRGWLPGLQRDLLGAGRGRVGGAVGALPPRPLHGQARQVGQLRQRAVRQAEGGPGLGPAARRGHGLVHRDGRLPRFVVSVFSVFHRVCD